MSSKNDTTLLIPGQYGWEIWQGNRDQGFHRTLENGPVQASGLEKLPSGNLLMGFPVRQALAIPFRVQTEDEEMFEDLAAMHMEKSGIRPDADAGRLTDVFPAGHEDGQTTLLGIVLSAPARGSMPVRAPRAFDISARFFLMEANAVTLWHEMSRWVFAITSGGQLTYFQALSDDRLGSGVVRDIGLAYTQLSLQGVNLDMSKAVIWTSGHDSDPSDEEIQAFGKEIGIEVTVGSKPRPVLPDPLSRLVPADVRAEQRLKERKRKRNTVIAAVLIVYLCIAGYLAYEYFQLNSQLKKQDEKLADLRSEYGDIGVFNDRWDQLAPVVDSQHWPLQLLYRTATLIPAAQDVRFKEFEARRDSITIVGETSDLKLHSSFGGKLRRSLSDYDWVGPPPASDNKSKRWKFTYEGTLKGEEGE